MLNRKFAAAALLLLAASAATPTLALDSDYENVVACMRANVPPALHVQDFQLESIDRQGESRTLTGQIWFKRQNDLLRTMMRLEGPANVRGAAYLVRETPLGHEDEMYVFLPAVNRVRHITGSFANGPLLGTDFSYAEAKLLQNAYTGGSGKLLGEAVLDGRPVYKLSLRPGASRAAPYNRIETQVDKKTCVALRADFYEGDKLSKQLLVPADSLLQFGDRWFPSRAEMTDLGSGTKTTLKAGPIKPSKDLSNLLFDPRTFSISR